MPDAHDQYEEPVVEDLVHDPMRVLSPNRAECSGLLKRAAGPRIDFLEDARKKFEYRKSEGTPRQDET